MWNFLRIIIIASISFVAFSQEENESPKAPLLLQIITPEKNEIRKYAKLELGFEVPERLNNRINAFIHENPIRGQRSINPFLEWELDIVAVFKHLETGQEIERSGFYYVDMQRDFRLNGWRNIDTEFPLRVRFAPTESGEWEVNLKLNVLGELYRVSQPLKFTVLESTNKGFVSLHSSKRYFERDGEMILPTGANLPFPSINNNRVWTHNPKEKLNLETWYFFQNDIQRYVNEGGKYFRFFMSPLATEIEFEKLGNYFDRQYAAWEMDKMIDFCEENDVLINFNLMYHTPIMQMADYYMFAHDYTDNWHDPSTPPHKDVNPPYAYSKEFNSRMPSDFPLNPEAMRFFKQRIRYIMARWGYTPAISTIELLSEPWHMNENWMEHYVPYDSIGALGDSARKAAHIYHREIANYIKEELNINHYLLGAVGKFPRGQESIFSNIEHPNIKYNDSSWFEKNIDFISLSYYASQPDKMIISKRGRSNNDCEEGENSYTCGIEKLQNVYDKPVIFGESDHGDFSNSCSDLEGHKIDLMRLNLSGVAGHYIWGAYMYKPGDNVTVLDQRRIWPEIVKTQNYYEQDFILDILKSGPEFGRQRSTIRGRNGYLKEHHYITNKDESNAVGVLYNRTFNIGNAITEPLQYEDPHGDCTINNESFHEAIEITWRPKKMTLQGLQPRTNYLISYFDYKNHSLVNVFEVRSNRRGNLNLVHPVLGKDRLSNPLYWYKVTKVE